MQIVAIKQLDRNSSQGIREFVAEVLTLSNAEHPNLVKLIGYCAEGDQKLLVYEYMPLGSLEEHLHGKQARFFLLYAFFNITCYVKSCISSGNVEIHLLFWLCRHLSWQ